MATPKGDTLNEQCISFHDQCSGSKGYSFNLTSLTEATTVDKATKITVQQINDTLTALSDSMPIEKFYIGKTSCSKVKKPEITAIDPTDENTITKGLLSGRWSWHSRAGKDGLVVVAIITEEVAQNLKIKVSDCNYKRSTAENGALMIEKGAQDSFTDDPRLDHEGQYSPGPSAKGSEAFLVYIAFKYLKPTGTIRYHFNLCDLSSVTTVSDAANVVEKRIEDIYKDLKRCNEKEPHLFYDHAYVEKAENCTVLNPMDPSTFNKEGIQKKWAVRIIKGCYTKDEMNVVAVVTTDIATKLGCPNTKDCIQRIIAKLLTNEYTKQDKEVVKEKRHVGCSLCVDVSYNQIPQKESVFF